MARYKKLQRDEVGATALNMLDIGFTVSAIAAMLKKNKVTLYSHLRRAGRTANRTILRKPCDHISAQTYAHASRMFADPEYVLLHMMVVAKQSAAQQQVPVSLKAAVKRRKKGGRKPKG